MADVHVVSKSDNRQQATFRLPPPTAQLAPSSVRVRPVIVSLTSNNLSYARGGTLLRWWDTYPVPAAAPAPYNDQTKWGMVPSWGVAIVLESTTSLAPGTALRGFWPMSSHPVDLTLTPAEPSGHWIEISPHRQQLMPIYNRYTVEERDPLQDMEKAAWESVFAIWNAGYLMSEYVFPPDPKSVVPIHPSPSPNGPEWSAEDADLTTAAFISLAASTKTARSIAYNMFCRSPKSGPLGFLQVTSAPEAIAEAADKFRPSFSVRTLSYADIHQAEEWLEHVKPTKIVITDCGSRDGVVDALLGLLQGNQQLKSIKHVILQIGSQQKVYTPDELAASQKAVMELGKIRFNTSSIREMAAKHEGPAAFYSTMSKRWNQWLEQRAMSVPDMRLVWGEGVVGKGGIEGGWEALTQSKVNPREALVYRM